MTEEEFLQLREMDSIAGRVELLRDRLLSYPGTSEELIGALRASGVPSLRDFLRDLDRHLPAAGDPA
ncbi:MAG: hypothetical protein M0Q87_10410 [Ottowia sp.]|nr:hypothetical protein [Ottowia sp.]